MVSMSGSATWRRMVQASVVAGVLAQGQAVRADSPLTIPRGWYISPGLPFAAVVRDGGLGFATGAEVSVAGYEVIGPPGHGWWTGIYADAVQDFGAKSWRASIGPELGYAVVGVDGGLLLERRDGRLHEGMCIRPLLTIGIISVYGRGGWLPGAASAVFGEAGVVLKMPINIHCEHGTPGCAGEP